MALRLSAPPGWKIVEINGWKILGFAQLNDTEWSGLSDWVKGWSAALLQFNCLNRICWDKHKYTTQKLCTKEGGQDFSQSILDFSGD